MTDPDTKNGWPRSVLCLSFQGNELDVRQALECVLSKLAKLDLSLDDRGTVELVLAEVLNNIVEHACAGNCEESVEIAITRRHSALKFVVVDTGRAIPGGTPPAGQMRDIDYPRTNLPEGGFGWALIRELAEDLKYSRKDDRNRLSFRIDFNPASGSGCN